MGILLGDYFRTCFPVQRVAWFDSGCSFMRKSLRSPVFFPVRWTWDPEVHVQYLYVV